MNEPLRPQGRLGMLDVHGSRQFIIPAEVRGRFHSARKKLHFILIIFFLAMPWISIRGKQLLLFNIPDRQFHFFGIELFAHDTPLIFFLVMIFAIGLALVTSLFGRVWCGWACPQTVFIDSVYREIEKWIEGNYLERRKLHGQPWDLRKTTKVTIKWLLYVLVSSLIAHSVIAYFSGSKELLEMIQGPPSGHTTYFLLVSSITALLLFNFAWFREQFCVIMCPYGKFQAALMDQQSVTVMYDEDRGEPRKGTPTNGKPQGDCVSCQRCVQVCPTKIDIRNGLQLECIACTACVDACDEIMTKINKPKGLIRYKAATAQPVNWLRPRTLFYSAVLSVCAMGFAVLLAKSEPFRTEILRAKNNPFTVRNEGEIQRIENQFIWRIENHYSHPLALRLQTDEILKVVVPVNPLVLGPNQKRDIPLFISIKATDLKKSRYDFKVLILDATTGKLMTEKSLSLIGTTSLH